MKIERTLIFFTNYFPFESGEEYLEGELPFLTAAFDRIFILSSSGVDQAIYELPSNVKVAHFPYHIKAAYKLKAVLNFFTPVISNEIKFIKTELKLKLNVGILKYLFGSLAKAFETKKEIEKLIKENNIDIKNLYLYSYWMNDFSTGIAMFKKHNKQVKAFTRAHGWDLYFFRHPSNYIPLRNYTITHLNAVYCISQNGKDYIDNITAHRYSNKLKLSRIGSMNHTGAKSGFNPDKLLMVSCSYIFPPKRIHLIIEALTLINDIDITWLHFGTGPDAEIIQGLALEKLTMKNISYQFMGLVANKDLLEFYKKEKVDVFINVSETEGIPVTIMEAASYGIPSIATNVGGVPEIVYDGENGYLLAKDCTPVEIAESIKKLYLNPQEIKTAMGKRSVEIWDEKFNANNNYRAFIGSITSLT